MGSNPLNLGLRFLLELSALGAMSVWGWRQNDGWLQNVLVIGLPLVAGAIWGIFAVVDDPSRSGAAPIPVPGIIRLLIEFAFFGLAVWMAYDMGYIKLSLGFGILIILHYAISYDRIQWLWRQ